MKDLLVLKSDRCEFERYFIEGFNDAGIPCEPFYKSIVHNGVFRNIALVWMQLLRLPYQQLWYGDWAKDIKKYNTVIIFDRVWGWDIIKYIKKMNPECRIIYWYWNIITENTRLYPEFREICEEWTFDEGDAEKYSIRLNSQFHCINTDIESKNSVTIMRDVFFLGADKGRREEITKVAHKLKKMQFTYEIKVVGNKANCKYIEYMRDNMAYSEYIQYVMESKCLLDIPQKQQEGFTLRVLEAMFLNKKLITTNKSIRNHPCYNSNNIFIFGEHDDQELLQFITKRVAHWSQNDIDFYGINRWIKRF